MYLASFFVSEIWGEIINLTFTDGFDVKKGKNGLNMYSTVICTVVSFCFELSI